MTSKRALVTGGAGFIGSNVVHLLLSKGVRVRVLDDLSTGCPSNLSGLPIEFVEADVRDSKLVQAAMQNVTWVFHLAAAVGNVRSIVDPGRDAAVNVLGTITALEAAQTARVQCFVYSSSAAIFGEPVSMPIAEDHPQDPGSPYGVSKLAAERYVMLFGRLYDMRVVSLRYFNAYGVNQRYDEYGNVIPIFAERLLGGRPLRIYGDGTQTRDFVNVKDVAAANYLAAVSKRASGPFNIGSGTRCSLNELARLSQAVHGPSTGGIEHAAPRKGEVRHCEADIRRARTELGFRPTLTLDRGLREYFDWLRRETLVRR